MSDKGLSFTGVRSKTQQAPAGFMTPSQMMAKYKSCGIEPMKEYYKKMFGVRDMDATLQGHFRAVEDAELAFNSLPSKVRDRFNNSPVELLKFLGDTRNRDEAITLGLIDAPKNETSTTSEKVVENQPSVVSSANE